MADFPANSGCAGTNLSIFEVAQASGKRMSDEPLATFPIEADGNWGPVEVDSEAYYEFQISSDNVDSYQHFYPQRFLRNSHLVRLLSGDPDSSATRQATNVGPEHVAVVILRMREWYALEDDESEGDERDIVEIGLKRDDGEYVSPVNVMRDDIDNDTIALQVHDDAETPRESTLAADPVFASNLLLQVFQGSVALFSLPPIQGSPRTLS